MEKSRTHFTILNSGVNFIIQIATMGLKFWIQTLLIMQLGKLYVGVNGLFTNILSMLSFVELGIGPAIIFSMYKPIANNDKLKISAYMNFYRKTYNMIGVLIFTLGIMVVPFLEYLIKGPSVPNLQNIYLLFLCNSVVSYFFTYKRSILTANQRDYINSKNKFFFNVVQILIQSFVLIITKNYIFYLGVAIVITIASNLSISKKVNNDYPFLLEHTDKKLTVEELKQMKQNVTEMVGAKFGGVILNGTDNLLISSMLSLAIVGVYSNYLLIVSSVNQLMNPIISSVTSSIGNLGVENNSEKSEEIFNKHFFINFMMILFCSTMMMNLFEPFILLWLGKEYVLSTMTTFVIVLNFCFQRIRQTPLSFIMGFGLFRNQGIKSVFEAIFNLIVSYLLIKYSDLGISGVLIGTILTNLLINSWWENRQVFNFAFKKNLLHYLFKFYGYIVLLVFLIIISYIAVSHIQLSNELFSLFVRAIYTITLDIIFIIVFFSRTNEYQFVLNLMKIIILKKNKKII